MPISAEMKVHVAALGNDLTWPKCSSTELPNWTFINNLQGEVLDLVAIIRSDKCGGTIGHLGLIMSAREFALVPSIVNHPFPWETHPGEVNYLLPTAATTVNQHTDRRLENHALLHVFELEQMIDEQMKKHAMFCFTRISILDSKIHKLATPTSQRHESLNIYMISTERRPRNCKTRPSSTWRKKWTLWVHQSLPSVSSKRSYSSFSPIWNKQSPLECKLWHTFGLSKNPASSTRLS